MSILLPKTYKGDIEQYKDKPMLSYSQVDSWRSKSGFHTGLVGMSEYILKYFMGTPFPDAGWGQFGTEVEGYICNREYASSFTDDEKKLLDTITPLGTFQSEMIIDFGEFILLGFIDDATEDMTTIRDYKTASASSSKKYYSDDYVQLDVYSLMVKNKFGYLPKKTELCIIDRLGGMECMQGGGRDALKVGKEIWWHERPVLEKNILKVERDIIQAAKDISDTYKLYLEIVNQKTK